jgi:hypothetical protein
MKLRLFSLLIALFAGIALQAQTDKSAPSDEAVRKTTETLVAKYKLNADQAKQMYTIQVRKNRNMASIASLETTDQALYLAKWANVQKGTLSSIRRILKNKEQVDLYNKTQGEIRSLRGQKRKELSVQKATKNAVEYAVLAIYAE